MMIILVGMFVYPAQHALNFAKDYWNAEKANWIVWDATNETMLVCLETANWLGKDEHRWLMQS